MRVRSNHIANAVVRERPKFRSAVHGSWRLSVETGQQSIGGRRRKHRRRRADSRGRGDEFVYRLGERREQSVRCYTWSVVVGTIGSSVRKFGLVLLTICSEQCVGAVVFFYRAHVNVYLTSSQTSCRKNMPRTTAKTQSFCVCIVCQSR